MIEIILLAAVVAFSFLNTIMIWCLMQDLKRSYEEKDSWIEIVKTIHAITQKNLKSVTDQVSDYNLITQRKFRTVGDSFKYISEQLKKIDEDMDSLTTDIGEDLAEQEKHYCDIYEQFEHIRKELEKLNEGKQMTLDINPPPSLFDTLKNYDFKDIPEAHYVDETEQERLNLVLARAILSGDGSEEATS